ncbi:MAG: hypothetical protein U0414_10930 [Polyangiaceae bacterium]
MTRPDPRRDRARSGWLARLPRGFAALAILVGTAACSGAAPVATDPLVRARRAAESSKDGEVVGRWLLAELLAPGGEPTQATAARAALDALTPRATGMYASFARGVDDEAHGRLGSAAGEFLEAVAATQAFDGPEVELLARYASRHLITLRSSVPHLWTTAKPVVEKAIEHPAHLGLAARNELVTYWAAEEHAAGSTEPWDEVLEKHLGCVSTTRFAGPFGRVAPGDGVRHFDAESPGPWPMTFAKDPSRIVGPAVLEGAGSGCHATADAPDSGIFYVETYVTLDQDHDAVLAVEGATGIFVDDTEVLRVDPDRWGAWPRSSVRLHLGAGRHRVLGRLLSPSTSIRLVDEQGLPLAATTSVDPSAGYTLVPPTLLVDPDAVAPFYGAVGVTSEPPPPAAPSGAPSVDVDDPILRSVAASLAHDAGRDDVASVLMEPLVRDGDRATGLALSIAASFVEGDPIFTENDARDVALDLRTRAAKKDALLWYPRLWLALDEARKQSVTDVLPKLTELSTAFPEVPEIIVGLSTIYSRLGWSAERETALLEAAKRFPDDTEILRAELELFDERGRNAEADAVVERLRVLDPRGLIDVERAVRRRDFDGAIRGLERAKMDHPEDKGIVARLEDLLSRAGRSPETFTMLEKALADDPKSESRHLAVADARYAAGDRAALRNALVDAIQRGAPTDSLRDAIELVEGSTELSPYRIDGLKTIRDYQASGAAALPEKATRKGNAARVLDYSALWIHGDGTARMLEHEILHMQSHEAISEHGEIRIPRGALLHLRTIKADGTIYEPELISGKPTVTMPHLDVGDYVETETIYTLPGDGTAGQSFMGPRWFFREEKIDYYRSEFVIISPKDKPLDLEITGDVPAPAVSETGAFVVRRYRVDQNPAVPEEPLSVPVEEFLPSVRAGWGVHQADTLARFVDLSRARTPRDPRLVRIAETILANGKKGDEATQEVRSLSVDEKARRIYRWVAANVENGKESDPRRAVTGKSGSRVEAFIYLARLVGVNVERGLITDRLQAPPIGPMSEAEQFGSFAVAVPGEKGTDYAWMLIGEKFAPYGYLPSSLRNQPAVLLVDGAPRVTTNGGGAADGITDAGELTLDAGGSATLSLEQSYSGGLAISLRSALETLPDARLKKAVESELLGDNLPGARLADVTLADLENLDLPLRIQMKIEISNFAAPRQGGLRIAPPFAPHLSRLVSFPTRQTPLFIPEQLAVAHRIELRIKLPQGARCTLPPPTKAEAANLSFSIDDRVEGDVLVLDRRIDLPAGRVQPTEYEAFAKSIRALDQAFEREIQIDL